MQNRFKSAPLWIATVANIAIIIGLFMPELNLEPYVQAIGVLITMLVQFGILNNPTNKKNF
jgi:uncharacterized membrane protein